MKKNGQNIQCQTCNRFFYVPRARVLKAKYCSFECSPTVFKKGEIPWNKGMKGWNSGKKNPFYGKTHTDEVKKRISLFLSTRPHSKKQKEAVSKATSGSKNYNWKGGVTPYRLKIRRNVKWKKWRKMVFKRDDYTCKKCSSRSGKMYDGTVILEAHHMIPVRKLIFTKLEKHIYNVANGITLCRPCHNLIPKK